MNARMNTPEQEIIEGCLKGEEQYFKLLYERFFGKMLAACMKYARDREEARDITHDGFIRVFKNLGQYTYKGSFEGWIRRIMVNNAINHYRQNKNLYKTSSLDELDEKGFEVIENQYGESATDYLYDNNELMEMIQALPPVYRMVFNLYVFEGFSHKEISAELGITESTSRSNLAKARTKLQKELTKKNNSIKIPHAV